MNLSYEAIKPDVDDLKSRYKSDCKCFFCGVEFKGLKSQTFCGKCKVKFNCRFCGKETILKVGKNKVAEKFISGDENVFACTRCKRKHKNIVCNNCGEKFIGNYFTPCHSCGHSNGSDSKYKCKNCGNKISAPSANCDKCGYCPNVHQNIICKNCGNSIGGPNNKCDICGYNPIESHKQVCDNCGESYEGSNLMICPNCGFDPKKNFDYTCNNCGEILDGSLSTCSRCGHNNREDFNYKCSNCGESIGDYQYNTCQNCGYSPYGNMEYRLYCEIHGEYIGINASSSCPECVKNIEDKKKTLSGEGDNIVICENCNEEYLSRSNKNGYCPTCLRNLPGEGNNRATCINCKKYFRSNGGNGYCPACKERKAEEAAAAKEAKRRREIESYPAAIEYFINNLGVELFDLDSIEQFEYSDDFADSLKGKCGVLAECIDRGAVNLIKSINLGEHLKNDIRRSRLSPSSDPAKQALATATKEKRVTYAVLVASETMTSFEALENELLAAMQLKPIYWKPEFTGIGRFQYRIYVDCEDPKEVFKNFLANTNTN